MIWQQFQTLVWIRWRVTRNKLRSSGSIGVLLATLMVAFLLVSTLTTFFGALALGIFLLPQAPPEAVFAAWAIIVFIMLVFWMIGLMTELQRSEVLSLKQFLHLPVSGRSIFLLNFASSFACLTMVVFLPLILGLTIAHLIVDGPIMLLLFPVIGSLLLALTSATYQLRGWLALMMEDKRRAKNIAVMAILFFIGISQTPQFFSVYARRNSADRVETSQEISDMVRDVNAGKMTDQEFSEKVKERDAQREVDEKRIWQYILIGAKCIPPGWLPYAVFRMRGGQILPSILVSLGGLMISSVCLWRGYQTTLRHCRGEYSTGKSTTKATTGRAKDRTKNWLELQLPFVSPQTSAVAMMNLRNTTRAPEARMMFITPLILFGVMSGSLFTSAGKMPSFVHPAFALLFLSISIVSMAQLTQNAFGLDRSGFRSFVLSPVPRRDILLAKNISALPFSLFFGLIAIVICQFVFPMTIDGIVATVVQIVGLFLGVCCVANYASIWAPTAIAIGTAKKARPTLVAGLLQMLAMMLIPIATLPQLAACGVAVLSGWTERFTNVPVYTLSALLALAVTCVVYWRVLSHQAKTLQDCEITILRRITSKDE